MGVIVKVMVDVVVVYEERVTDGEVMVEVVYVVLVIAEVLDG